MVRVRKKKKKTLQKLCFSENIIEQKKKHKLLFSSSFKTCCPALSQASKNCCSIIHNLLDNYCWIGKNQKLFP